MKNLIVFLAIIGLTVSVYAQSTQQDKSKSKPKTEQTQLKDHVCTAACQNGNHVYAHGEKGHVCTDACKTASASKDAGLKDHVCTSACQNGKHVYAHGEKGHVCGPECKKM